MTIAYDSSGLLLWKATYNGAYNGDDIAYNVTSDGTYIYVSGSSQAAPTGYAYVTIQYAVDDYIIPTDTEAVTGSMAFYNNAGQIVSTSDSLDTDWDVYFTTMYNNPKNYFLADTISYVFSKVDTSSAHNDTLQRIDLSFPRPPKSGKTVYPVGDEVQSTPYYNFYLPQCPYGATAYPYQRIIYPNVWSDIDIE